jgi:membrane protease YdiL (CAAX protease family)
VAVLSAFVLAVVGGLVVDIPAGLLGVNVTHHVPGGLELADTFVQELAFVAAAVLFAQVGGRKVHAWQLGMRRPWTGARRRWWSRLLWLVAIAGGLYLAYIGFTAIWASALHVTEKEKLLEALGANEGTALLALSAALTCVVAPICEEVLFRGYLFQALSNWRGVWPAATITAVVFGAAHAGSAPAVDLVPLGVLGFLLCLLYRWSGSLYPSIAVHALNNCLAFGALEGWGWQIPVLLVGALATLASLAFVLKRTGVISPEPPGGSTRGAVPAPVFSAT